MATAVQTDNMLNLKWPKEGPSRVPYWVYSSPEIYKREQELVFGGASYNYIGLECEIPNPGDFRQTKVGDKPVIFMRDEDGQVHVVVNRCAHRGVQFCYDMHGKDKKEFICPYHQWTYNLKGETTAVPFRRGLQKQGGMPGDFDLKANGLQKLKVATRHGVIFASFDHSMPSFEDYIGPKMVGWFDRVFSGRPLKVLGYQRQRIRCNWKLVFENIKDPYHASLLHVFLVSFSLFRADNPSKVQMDEKLGLHSVLVSQRGEKKADDTTSDMRQNQASFTLANPAMLQPEKEFPGEATVVMQTIWPNLMVQQQSNTLAMRQIHLVGPEEFELHWTYFGFADESEEMTHKRLRQANLMGPAGYVSADDSEVMEAIQAGISKYAATDAVVEMGGRGVEDTEHMVTETAIRAFYDGYRKVMGL
ncbi:MAG TPA: SRPBCC family protein [Alphaproteobacteria bacterium]|nr:SRPBCC family protein [Alphaproteobacteria bacterium]